MNQFETFNPVDEEKINVHTYMSEQEVVLKIEKLSTSFDRWKTFSIEQRVQWLEKIRNSLKESIPELSQIITRTMGKPLVESKLEIEKCITQFDYYIQKGPELIQQRRVVAHYSDMSVHYTPMGIVFAVMPWNYPVWQFFRFSVGAWLAGNVVLLKHSEITTAVGLYLEELAEKMGAPFLLQTIILEPNQSETVFSHKLVRAVTFTGSSRVGRRIGELSGRYLKKAVLELGGNDACIVDVSADLKKAAKVAVAGRLLNNGQSCISSKRFFIPEGKESEFMNLVAEELKTYSIGDPLDKKTKLGPLAQKKFFSEYNETIAFLSKASFVSTPPIPIQQPKGFFVSPRFFFLKDQMDHQASSIYTFFQQHEIFAPIGMVTSYKNDAHLYSLVNDSPYGLGAVWIGDEETFKSKKLHLQLDVGMIAVNEVLKSDARVPFGGVKDSGFGRESGEFGIREFCNTQVLGITSEGKA